MKKSIFLSYIFFFLSVIVYGESLPMTPKELYDEAAYAQAADAYLSALTVHPGSAELWYNLGNCYFRMGSNGKAIAAYRRAHKLAPLDEDITFNLNFVLGKTADKLEPNPKSFVVRQADKVADVFSSGAWALGAVLIAFIGFFCFLVYIFIKSYRFKKLGFGLSILCWLSSLFFISMAAHRYYYSLDSAAVIISNSVDILAEPNENGSRLLLLNEGATLKLNKQEGDWLKVELPNGTLGYLKSTDAEII